MLGSRGKEQQGKQFQHNAQEIGRFIPSHQLAWVVLLAPRAAGAKLKRRALGILFSFPSKEIWLAS